MGVGSLPICHASSAPSSKQRRACTPLRPVLTRLCRPGQLPGYDGSVWREEYVGTRGSWFPGSRVSPFLADRTISDRRSPPAKARSIVTTRERRLFRLRSARRAECLARPVQDDLPRRPSCRAFTYNTKAKWCFLKSDYDQLKPFNGRGRRQGRQPDRRAGHRRAAELSFFPAWMADEARAATARA